MVAESNMSGSNTDPLRVQIRARKRSIRDHLRLIASQKRWGRVRVAVRRAFIVSNGQPICVGAVLERAYPRLRQFKHWHRWSARRALLQVAVIIGRNRYGRGRPNLWAPREMQTRGDKTSRR